MKVITGCPAMKFTKKENSLIAYPVIGHFLRRIKDLLKDLGLAYFSNSPANTSLQVSSLGTTYA